MGKKWLWIISYIPPCTLHLNWILQWHLADLERGNSCYSHFVCWRPFTALCLITLWFYLPFDITLTQGAPFCERWALLTYQALIMAIKCLFARHHGIILFDIFALNRKYRLLIGSSGFRFRCQIPASSQCARWLHQGIGIETVSCTSFHCQRCLGIRLPCSSSGMNRLTLWLIWFCEVCE